MPHKASATISEVTFTGVHVTVTKSLKLGQGVLSMFRAVTLEARKASVHTMRSPSVTNMPPPLSHLLPQLNQRHLGSPTGLEGFFFLLKKDIRQTGTNSETHASLFSCLLVL